MPIQNKCTTTCNIRWIHTFDSNKTSALLLLVVAFEDENDLTDEDADAADAEKTILSPVGVVACFILDGDDDGPAIFLFMDDVLDYTIFRFAI